MTRWRSQKQFPADRRVLPPNFAEVHFDHTGRTFYEHVLILPQAHDPVLRIRRAGAVKTTIIDVKGQTTMKRKRPFR